jgi:membrane protein DedA with SNARE-associated domain
MDHFCSRQKGAAGLGRHRLPSSVVLAVVLVLASVTDKLATFATNVVGDLGLPGVFLLMVAESACIPIPSEATMLFAGFNVHEGEYPLWAAVAVGSAANLVGSWIAYAVGYYGRLELLEKHGKFLHITPSHLAWADRWFERYGAPAVFFSRMLPIVRTFISLPAGVARMPFWKFSVFTIAGCVPWVFALAFAGQKAAENWTSWKDSLHYVDYTVAVLIVVGIVYLAVRRRRNRNRGRAADAPA